MNPKDEARIEARILRKVANAIRNNYSEGRYIGDSPDWTHSELNGNEIANDLEKEAEALENQKGAEPAE